MPQVYIDKTAIVKTKEIGDHTKIWQYCVVLDGAKIGMNVNINSHCFLENDVSIGNNVTIKCGVYLWDGMIVEDWVQIGPNVTFTNDKYPRAKQKYILQKILLKEGASVGAACVILGGLEIGRYAMVGAGSLVTKNIPDYELYYGNPAEFKGYVCECGKRLSFQKLAAKCECGKKYEKIGDIVKKKK